MKILLPDNSELELPDGASGLDAARAIGPKLAEQAVLVKVDGEARDLRAPLADGDRIQLLTTRDKDDPDALAVLRHSSAHLLAEAVRRLYPGVKIAIGPPIENGFYYDFDFREPIREEDLERIEAEIAKELKEGRSWERSEISREEAKERFAAEDEPYKVELVDTAEGDISLYTQSHAEGDDFTDLCRGPHLQNSKPIKALKLTHLAGAYWRGDSTKPQLTRIYGTAFYAKEDLDAYLERLERARSRDHRRLGPQLDLFHMSEYSPGAALWTARGMAIYNALEDLRRRENARRGYSEVKTPLMWDVELWKRSGHWEKYGDNLFRIEHGDSLYGLKPMNCPGHMLLFNTQLRSYRDLPIRYAEAAVLHRDEPTGSLQGLTRARQFSQDDAHVFCTEEQIQEEIDAMFDYVDFLYDTFGVRELAHAELATRPDNKLGTDEQWDHTEGVLKAALDRIGLPYRIAAGEGAFYGPKIDFFMDDALGRPWQMGTIQLDGQQPERLGCTYMGADNREHTPYVIHRALFGSLERFIGILLEHYGGALPFWLSPVQVRVLPVGEGHLDSARTLALRLSEAGYRTEVAEPSETIGKRIRAAELEKIPVTIVYGDKESDESLAVRERGGEQSELSFSSLLERLATL
ncbi:MAG TPA: threonine--tRNA ligase [Gaiellaceae bacterium]|nr:threonine--tRNA ligase [Gaiellaceae bacterium]